MPFILKGIIVIIISFLLLNIQLRIVNRIFPQKEEKRKILGYTLLMGAIVASALLLFTYIIHPFLIQTYTVNSVIYSIYIAIIGGIIAVLFAAKKHRRRTFIISTLTILAIFTGITELLFAGAGIGLIIIKATGEEVLKTASSQSLSTHNTYYKSDIIIFSILSGLGFALFENVVYFLSIESVGQFFVRGITTSLLHGIFTGCIGYILWKYAKTSYISYILAYTVGIVLHAIYNISLTTVPVLGGIVFTIGGYFLLSYLLFKSDRIYHST